ncbi:MAG: MFS transporter [Deltaproteobacteria bacterium]|nr:MFS transporter [Deltaproteobacteria bacterium]
MIRKIVTPTVIVAALGYFVDVYDLILFGMVRVQSLEGLGLSGEAVTLQGIHLLNMQMYGMLLGGILWGVLGDKRGRKSVLFGSILLYSLANIANGMVTDLTAYGLLRFVAGVGLAGELGAGITLVAEILPRQSRGYGTALVASVGILGALMAGYVANHFDWRVAYYIGGAMGLVLLALRMGVFESGMFAKALQSKATRGNLMALLAPGRLGRYLACILIGMPIWFVIGLPVAFAPEFARALGVAEAVNAASALTWCYIGLALGDLSSGLLSQWFKSRKRSVAVFMAITGTATLVYLNNPGMGASTLYALCAVMGYGAGYWAMFVTMGAEQFGTNLRATVATTVPNFVRGAVPLMTTLFISLKPGMGVPGAAMTVGGATFALAAVALWKTEETFHKDLDFLEVTP